MTNEGKVVAAVREKLFDCRYTSALHRNPDEMLAANERLSVRLAHLILSSCQTENEALEIVAQMPVDYLGNIRYDVSSKKWIVLEGG
jgi:hypothetical protein